MPIQEHTGVINNVLYVLSEIFLGLNWGRISARSQFQNEQKLPKMDIIPSTFWWKFHEKLQMHENLHKNVNENMLTLTKTTLTQFRGSS